VGGCLAALAWRAFDTDFLVTFVVIRWVVVLILLTAPLAHRLLVRSGRHALPLPFQTPVTALLLTCESICFDIISAQF
jgi:hypothetical protein